MRPRAPQLEVPSGTTSLCRSHERDAPPPAAGGWLLSHAPSRARRACARFGTAWAPRACAWVAALVRHAMFARWLNSFHSAAGDRRPLFSLPKQGTEDAGAGLAEGLGRQAHFASSTHVHAWRGVACYCCYCFLPNHGCQNAHGAKSVWRMWPAVVSSV